MRATDVVSFLSLYVVLSTAELRSGSAERALWEFYGRWIVELMRELSETCAVRSRESLNTTSENVLRTLTERGTGPGVWSSSLTSARV